MKKYCEEVDQYGRILLHHAHAFGYLALLIKFLIDAYPEGVDVKDEQGKS
jgi:hypothetical protein